MYPRLSKAREHAAEGVESVGKSGQGIGKSRNEVSRE